MSVPYKNPISSVQVSTPQSVSRTSVFGTNFSILNVGGFMEVYNLSDLSLTLTATSYPSLIQLSANTIPIRYTKGNGTFLSPDYLTLNSDNISSGRRRLGMMVYVHETDTVYQYVIPNYDTLWNNLSGLTGFSSVTYSDYTTVINSRSSAGQAFLSGWTSSNIEGVSGFTSTNSNWRVYLPGGSTSGLYLPLSGGTLTGTYGNVNVNPGNTQSMIVFSGSNTIGGTGYTDFIKVINTAVGATNINKTIRVNNTGSIEFINSAYNATIFTIGDNGVITINSPASVTSNSATNNAINIGTKGQLFDDGNFHIHGSSGAVWINALDGSAIRLGTQTNTGNSPVIVDTTTVGHSFFTKVQSGFNVAFGTEITMDNLKVRINGTGGSGGLVQAGAVSGSFAAYTTLVGNVAGSAIQGDTNSGGITFTTTYQNISGVQKTLSAGGDTTTLHLIDTTNSRIYRITAIHCQGTTGGYTSIERMS
jgi:hypothetical protein